MGGELEPSFRAGESLKYVCYAIEAIRDRLAGQEIEFCNCAADWE